MHLTPLVVPDYFKPVHLNRFTGFDTSFATGNGNLFFNGIDPFKIRQQNPGSPATPDNDPIAAGIKFIHRINTFRRAQDIDRYRQLFQFSRLDARKTRISGGCAYSISDDLRSRGCLRWQNLPMQPRSWPCFFKETNTPAGFCNSSGNDSP